MTGSPFEPGRPDGAGPFPLPVPEVVVTDDDRNRYGLLLDRAAERGLLDPYEYEVRLKDLAAASTIDQMNRIVTELPAFAHAPPPVRRERLQARRERPQTRVTGPSAAAGAARGMARRRRSSPWLMLAIVIAVVAVALVFLAVFATHLVHTRNSGLRPPVAAARSVSAPRR